jgi:calmodulin
VKTLVKVREHAEAGGGFNLKAAFAKFDVDGDGTISHEELTTVLLSIIPDLAYDQILAVIHMFDPNNDGDVAYVEFAHTFYNAEVNDNSLKARKAMVRIRRMASTKRGFHLREAFQRFDKDGDGSVSHDELKVVINDILQGDITEEEMIAVIELFDPDGDGDIRYAEFRDLFYSISVDQEKQRDVCDHRGKVRMGVKERKRTKLRRKGDQKRRPFLWPHPSLLPHPPGYR